MKYLLIILLLLLGCQTIQPTPIDLYVGIETSQGWITVNKHISQETTWHYYQDDIEIFPDEDMKQYLDNEAKQYWAWEG